MARRDEGTLKQRGSAKDAPWLVRVYKGEVNGKRVYVSATLPTKAEAKAKLKELLGSKAAGRLATPSRQTLGEYLKRWLETEAALSVGPRTLRDYTEYLRRYILPFPIASKRLSALTGDDIAARYAEMHAVPSKRTGAPLEPRVIHFLHAVLKLALKRAVVTRLLPSNPAEYVTLPRLVKKEKRSLTQAEADAFLDACAGDPWEAWWTLLLMTGMRPIEAAGLKWSDWTGDRLGVYRGRSAGETATHETKTKRYRVLHLGGIARAALEAHKVRQQADIANAQGAYVEQRFIFAKALGEPVNTLTLSKRPFSRVLKKAGIPKQRPGEQAVTPYSLRHTSASLPLANGEQVLAVSQRLGHTDATLVLKMYGHVLPGVQEAVTARYESGFRRSIA